MLRFWADLLLCINLIERNLFRCGERDVSGILETVDANAPTTPPG